MLLVLLVTAVSPARAADEPLVCIEYSTAASSVAVPALSAPESSGLAAGRVDEGVYYTLEDAGNDAVIYPFRLDGLALRPQVLEGATNTDWEDIAAGPCPSAVLDNQPDAEGCLYVADIGDNDETRDHVTLWVVPETTDDTVTALGCDLVYADGKAHDAEALAVSPDGVVRIFTKSSNSPTEVYKANSLSCFGEPQTIDKEAEIELDEPVTGAAMRADGQALVLRAKEHAWLWAGCSLRLQDTPTDVDLPGEPFGEAVTFTPDGLLATTQEEATFTVRIWPCDTQQDLSCPSCGCGTGAPLGWTAALGGLLAAALRRQRATGST